MRKCIIVFFICLITFLYAQSLPVNFYSFVGGLNTKWSKNVLLDNQCSDVDNLLFDKKLGLIKRDGYKLKATINSAGNYINGIEYNKSSGDKFYIQQKGSSLYKSIDLETWESFETGLNTTYDCRFAVYQEDLWRVNGNNMVASYNATTLTTYSFIPKGRFIAIYNESIFIGNTIDEKSALYFSDVVAGPKSSTAWKSTYAFYVNRNSGDEITGLYVWQGILWIFTKNSIWGLSGYSIDDYTLRKYTDEFGCIDDRTIQVKDNSLLFLSSKGLIRFNGSMSEIISEMIEPSINDLSAISKVDRRWTQTTQSEFQLGTANNVDITNYPGEIRNSSATYKLWTSSTDFSNGMLSGSVNIDTVTFSRNGLICNEVGLTDDFSSGVISSSWTITSNTYFTNSDWRADNYTLYLSTAGATSYSKRGTIFFNNYKDYGRRKFDTKMHGSQLQIYVFSDDDLQADKKTYLGLALSYQNGEGLRLYENNSVGTWNVDAVQDFLRPSDITSDQALWQYLSSTRTFCVGKDYDGKYSLTVDNREWKRGIIFHNLNYAKDVNLSAFRIEGPSQDKAMNYNIDNFGIYTSTYSTYISSWDTTVASPIWEVFTSSAPTYGMSDIGFQTRVSSTGATWDDWIGVANGAIPTSASKRYIQIKATTTVNTMYEVLSPEIRELYLSRNSTGSFTSQEKYVGSVTKWGTIDIDDTDNIGYFVAGATSSYNLSIASYIPVSNGDTIPLNPSANYVKWQSTYTSAVSQITYGVTLNWDEGSGAGGSSRYASGVFDKRYWLSCSSNNSTNNIIYVLDSNDVFTKFSNIDANMLFEFNNQKYFASSKDNNIFEFDDINTDSGTAINSFWKSGHNYLGNQDIYKWLRYVFFTGRKQSGDFINFDYSLDNSTVTYNDYVSFSDNQNIPKEFGQDKIGKNFYFTIRSTGTFELQGFDIYKENKEINVLIP